MNKYKFNKMILQIIVFFVFFIFVGFLLVKFSVIKFSKNNNSMAISLNCSEMGLKVGDNYQLQATVFSETKRTSTSSDINWYSSDNKIVSVDKDKGIIYARKPGIAVIKAEYLFNDLDASCIVNVSNDEIVADNINISTEKIFLSAGDSYELNYDLYPNNSNMHQFIMYSSDNSVVLVNDNGIIKGLKPGRAIVTIMSKINNIKDSVVIYVYDSFDFSFQSNLNHNYEKYIKTKKIYISDKNIEIGVGFKTKLNAVVLPSEANQNVNWISTNSSVATVDNDGIITGIKEGNVMIIATTIDGISSICEVSVLKKNSDEKMVKFNEQEIILKKGEIKKINYSFLMSVFDASSIKWTSSNEDIVTVLNGVLIAKEQGECFINFSAANNNLKEVLKVKVLENESMNGNFNLSFLANEYKAYVGDTISLIGMNNFFNNLKWSSSNEMVALVNNGNVKCLKKGETTISVSDGNHVKKVKIYVDELVPNFISIEEDDEINIPVGINKYIIKNIFPSNCSNQEVKWYSSNDSIVSVDKFGLIKTKSKGEAIITVETFNGKSSSIKISVN